MAKQENEGELPNCQRSRRRQRNLQPSLDEIVRSLVLETGHPSCLLELYYWSQEPALLDLLRAFAGMQKRQLACLAGFLTTISDRRRLTVARGEGGDITLTMRSGLAASAARQ